jgi:dihydrofolate reductase
MKNSTAPEVEYISTDIVSFIIKLKGEAGKNFRLAGGAMLASVLENASLIDDYIISIHPVFLGSGKPLFSEASGIRHLHLREYSNFPSGLVQLPYSRIQINKDQNVNE